MLEVQLRGRKTAFQVRKAFASSPTEGWTASAGAVYPAIKRLVEKSFLKQVRMDDARGTNKLSVTRSGRAAVHRWAIDPNLATRLSTDPFRTRVDYLASLPSKKKDDVLQKLREELIGKVETIDRLLTTETASKAEGNFLAVQLLRTRLQWLEQESNAADCIELAHE